MVSSTLDAIDKAPTVLDTDKLKAKIKFRPHKDSLSDTVLNLNVIFITLDNEDDAYLIFETLNTRGKELALTDLVKNHFSKQIKKVGTVDIAKEKWQP